MAIGVRAMTVARLSGTVGVRIEGLDLSRELDDETMDRLRELYDTYHLLVIQPNEVAVPSTTSCLPRLDNAAKPQGMP